MEEVDTKCPQIGIARVNVHISTCHNKHGNHLDEQCKFYCIYRFPNNTWREANPSTPD